MILRSILVLSLWLLINTASAQNCNTAMTASTPNSRFVINTDGTATDTRTQLTWQRCPLGYTFDNSGSGDRCVASGTTTFSWQAALQAAASDTSASFSDWRVPNVLELVSIVEYRCALPAINTSIFPDNTLASQPFWTSTPLGHNRRSMTVDFDYGKSNGFDRSGVQFPVRLVR